MYSTSPLVFNLTRVNSAEGDENVFWPWLYPLRGWRSLTMTFLDKS